MKEIEEIIDFSRAASDIIYDLKQKNIVVPPWDSIDYKHPGLKAEYYPQLHPVMTDKSYRDKATKDGEMIHMSRITMGLQKLATKRMAEMCFTIPVKRTWSSNTDKEREASMILESLFEKNKINGLNIDRAEKLYASCEIATIWFTKEQESMYAGHKSQYKLRCRTYSPMDGSHLYPLFDEYDDMIALSYEYIRMMSNNSSVTYFETFTANKHMRWRNEGIGWIDDMSAEDVQIEKIAGVYARRDEPIWEQQSGNVYEAEWARSRNGNYLRRNSKPTWVEFVDAEDVKNLNNGDEDDDKAARGKRRYPANAKAGYVTWNQAVDSLKYHVDSIKSDFFEQLQLPNNSFDNMKTTPMSGEARKMLYVDCQMKVIGEMPLWIDFFSREINVVKAFAKKMFPEYANEFDSLEFKLKITPFNIKDESEQIKNGTDATGGKAIMSRRTAIQKYTDIDDIDTEIKQIDEDETGVLEEPTE